MTTLHPLQSLVKLNKESHNIGIYSACSANEYVLDAVLQHAKETNSIALIEATANQVNQFGGYTGMQPKDFVALVQERADKIGLPMNRVILGGDHLGPLTWTSLEEEQAMANSEELIRQYVLAGFTKIHIDTSMRIKGDDPNAMLSTLTIAKRGARLAKVATLAYQELKNNNPNAIEPVYIVGSEVPIPGGAQEAEDSVQVTKPADFEATVQTFHDAFIELGLENTWERVIAVVVQPGVEFGDEDVIEYNREEAKTLCSTLTKYPNIMFEGHSTDYQSAKCLKEMVEDGIGILKVGPALTFALREALFALANMEEAFYANSDTKTSKFIDVLENVMLENPGNWQKHYHGNEREVAFKRKYSFSDRCRYYLPNEKVQEALHTLIKNIDEGHLPLSLLSQYMPMQYTRVRNGEVEFKAEALIIDRIRDCIREYMYASNQQLIK